MGSVGAKASNGSATRQIRTSGLTSGDGKQGVAAWPKLPRPSSTLPRSNGDRCAVVPALEPATTKHARARYKREEMARTVHGARPCFKGLNSEWVRRSSRSQITRIILG